MVVTFLGKKWDLRFVPNLGSVPAGRTRGTCDPPDCKKKAIKILSSLEGEELLEVLIHEFLHASFWNIEEPSIEKAAQDIAYVLFKLGYRRAAD